MTWPPTERQAAAKYDAWYRETREGRRADRAERKLIEHLLRPFPAPGNLLEVGCGTGHFLRWLAKRPGNVVGVDRSPAMLEVLGGKGLSASVIQADARHLPFHERVFDVVLMVTMLEFVDDPGRALAEAVRVASRGVVLVLLNSWSLGGLTRRTRASSYRSSARDYSLREALRLLHTAAGSRLRTMRWTSTLFPGPLTCSLIPTPIGGDVLGVAVELDPA